MTQLTDDCFAFGGALVPLDTVMGEIQRHLSPVTAVEACRVWDAVDRILAEDVVPDRSVPPHDNSAVDGYAVRFDDLAPGVATRLPVLGRASAGHPWRTPVPPGHAVRVLTGAVVPQDLDTVFMEEDCTLVGADTDAPLVDLPSGIKRGANRRETGEDVQAGRRLLAAGRRLRAADLGLLASVGLTDIPVRTPLRVAVFSTGDEVREPGSTTPAGCVFDANRYALNGVLARMGCRVTDFGIIGDDRAACRDAFAAARNHDLVLASGGMSASEEDHVKAALTESGGEIRHWRLAIKPGRPVAVGQVRAGGPAFVGLPGNPVAVLITFLMVARPVIARLAGAIVADPMMHPVQLGFPAKKKVGRREFLRVTLDPPVPGEAGALPVAQRFASDGAGVLSSMAAADGLVVLGETVDRLPAGAVAPYLPFEGLL